MATHQEVEFIGKKYLYVSVDEYLQQNRNRGRLFFHDKKLEIAYFMVRNCLAGGAFGQQLMPIGADGCSNIVFRESFAYDHDDCVKKALLNNVFCEEGASDFVLLDEAVPLYHVWSRNFWHWTFECLPKVIALEERGYSGKYIVFNSKFIVEFLELLDVSRERICFSDEKYIVKNLVIPSMFTAHDLSRYSVACLRNTILDASGTLSGANRMYARRTGGRAVANEDAVMDVLRKYDFSVMVPEEHSVKEQFRLMTNVDLSVMPHGANCTLALAQKPHSVFMEFFHNTYIEYHTLPVIKTLGLVYIPLVDNKRLVSGFPEGQTAQTCNITVPIALFETMLENISRKRHG